MSLWNDIAPWIDKDTGLMTAPDGGRDNLILMTAYLIREMKRLGEPTHDLWYKCVWFLHNVTVDTGLFRRNKGDASDNSIDNAIGTCFISELHAKMIRHRWNWHFACFDVNHPSRFAFNRNFYARFIGVKAYIVAASGSKPFFVQRLLWCLSVVWSVRTSKGSSDPLLLSLQVDIMEKYCPRTAAYWKRHYSIKDLYTQYFGADFPLTKSRAAQ